MQIAHIIKLNTDLGWPMGLVMQNRRGPLGFIVRIRTLHHAFLNSLRKGTVQNANEILHTSLGSWCYDARKKVMQHNHHMLV